MLLDGKKLLVTGVLDRKSIAYATKIMEEIWDGAGAQDRLKIDRYAHLVGGCRMGVSARDSVVDSSQRAWEVPNLLVADGSVFPTEGSANPALVIMALSDRLAGLLADKRLGQGGAAEADASARRTRLLRREEPASRS